VSELPKTNTDDGRATALRDSIARLYEVFARYDVKDPVEGCQHCTSEADDRLLRSKPLHELAPADLERYAFKAMTTLGSVADFKHFLPRLLELYAHDAMSVGTDIEVAFSKLTYAKWNEWPAPERDAVKAFLLAYWRMFLSVYPQELQIDSCVCAIGRASDDMGPFLRQWQSDSTATSTRHLADLVTNEAETLYKKKALSNAYWSDRREQMQQVNDWLLDPQTVSWLEARFFDHADAPFAANLSSAIETLALVSRRWLGMRG
jgi:hypothetical protein